MKGLRELSSSMDIEQKLEFIDLTIPGFKDMFNVKVSEALKDDVERGLAGTLMMKDLEESAQEIS